MRDQGEREGLVVEIIDGLKKERGAWRAAAIMAIIAEIVTAAVLAAVIM